MNLKGVLLAIISFVSRTKLMCWKNISFSQELVFSLDDDDDLNVSILCTGREPRTTIYCWSRGLLELSDLVYVLGSFTSFTTEKLVRSLKRFKIGWQNGEHFTITVPMFIFHGFSH